MSRLSRWSRSSCRLRRTRSLTGLAALAALTSLAACAHEENGETIGSSHTAMSAPPAHADAGAAASDPQLPPGWRESFAQIGTLGASRGHGTGSWPATVFADEAGAKALSQRDDPAAGATLVEVHPGKTGELLFVMQKTGDGGGDSRWHYRVRDAAGVTRDPPACEECHGQAPHDHLFLITLDAGR